MVKQLAKFIDPFPRAINWASMINLVKTGIQIEYEIDIIMCTIDSHMKLLIHDFCSDSQFNGHGITINFVEHEG